MGDTEGTTHGLHLERRLAQPAGWTQTARIVRVQVAGELLPQGHFPLMQPRRLQSQDLPDKRPADETRPALPFDVSPVAHAAHFRCEFLRIHLFIGDSRIAAPASLVAPSPGFVVACELDRHSGRWD